MTLEQAKAVKPGDVVVSRLSALPFKPAKVAAVWVSADGALVRFQFTGAAARGAWVPADGYELPPAGHEWDPTRFRWIPVDPKRAGPSSSRRRGKVGAG